LSGDDARVRRFSLIGKGKHADPVNVEFKKDGKVLPANGKWQPDGAGQYRWTNAKGGHAGPQDQWR
jgi:hypothetical protein